MTETAMQDAFPQEAVLTTSQVQTEKIEIGLIQGRLRQRHL